MIIIQVPVQDNHFKHLLLWIKFRTISTFLPHIRQSKFNQKILILFLLKFIDKVTKILLSAFSSILILFSFDTKDTSLAPNSIKILFNDSRPPIFAI